MSTSSRLSGVYRKSPELLFDDNSKYIFLSDCHRGDGSKADDFAPNSSIYMSALEYYFKSGYTYIEIGDGDELWENDRFSAIVDTHRDVFLLIRKFHDEGRFYMLWGNHDVYKKKNNYLKKNMYEYFNPSTKKFEPLFSNLKSYEGLVLKYTGTRFTIFVVHGHQGDLMNDTLWPVARFLIRYIWRRLEHLGFSNPFSPAENLTRTFAVETDIKKWIEATNQMVIAGHTHKRAFAKPGEIPYFNDGCCAHVGYVSGIEIKNGSIALVKWTERQGKSGTPIAVREITAGPEKISSYI